MPEDNGYKYDPKQDIAIVGMSGAFPKAKTIRQFWQNLVDKVDGVTEAPDHWAPYYHDPEVKRIERTYTNMGGFLDDDIRFDPLEFGIMPNTVDGTTPDQFLALKACRDALADAGYWENKPFDRSRTGVVLGYAANANRGNLLFFQHAMVMDQTLDLIKQLLPEVDEDTLERVRADLTGHLPPVTAEIIPGVIANVLSGRIANRLDLQGPNYVTDAACTSSFISLDAAIRELRTGRSDMMLAGGINGQQPPQMFVVFSIIEALSHGKVRPFDKNAEGVLLGEGLGVVVLKRLEDAERDGDRIYAVIKGMSLASDGKSKGLLAPRSEGQVLSMERAYEETGIDRRTISLIEAHGTGIRLGDQTEISTLKTVFGDRSEQEVPVAVGGVKSMIGHTLMAAGIAGLIKTVLALYHKTYPPTLCDEVDPELELQGTPFYINNETRPWVHGEDHPRRAGVNAFGFGGINGHLIVDEYIPKNMDMKLMDLEWPHELLVFSSDSQDGLISQVRDIIGVIQHPAKPLLRDISYSLVKQAEGKFGKLRLAVLVGRDREDAVARLNDAIEKIESGRAKQMRGRAGIFFNDTPIEGKVAFLYPGHGSQYPNMFADLCRHFPKVREWFDMMDELYVRMIGIRPSNMLFPPPTVWSDEKREQNMVELFTSDASIGVTNFTANAMDELVRGPLGLKPDIMLGHSTGEINAIGSAGYFRGEPREGVEYATRLLTDIFNKFREETGGFPTGALMTVGAADHKKVEKAVADSKGELKFVLDNCPNQVLLYGTEEVIGKVKIEFEKQGAVCERMPFHRAFHTPDFKRFSELLAETFPVEDFRKGHTKLFSATKGDYYPDDPKKIHQWTAELWSESVMFRDAIKRLYDDGVRVFVEVGANANLTAFVNDTLADQKDYLAVASNNARRGDLEQLNTMLAQLYVNGHTPRFEGLYEHRETQLVGLKPDEIVEEKLRPTNRVLKRNVEMLSFTPEFLDELREQYPALKSLRSPAAPSAGEGGTAGSSTSPEPGEPGAEAQFPDSQPNGDPNAVPTYDPYAPPPVDPYGNPLYPPVDIYGNPLPAVDVWGYPVYAPQNFNPYAPYPVDEYGYPMPSAVDQYGSPLWPVDMYGNPLTPAAWNPPPYDPYGGYPPPDPYGYGNPAPAGHDPNIPAHEAPPFQSIPNAGGQVTDPYAFGYSSPSAPDPQVVDAPGSPAQKTSAGKAEASDAQENSQSLAPQPTSTDHEPYTARKRREIWSDLATPPETPPSEFLLKQIDSAKAVAASPDPRPVVNGKPFEQAYPLLGEIVERDENSIVCQRHYDVEKDIVLTSHAFGGPPSKRQPHLRPMAVVPFVMSIETAAEAAVCLFDGANIVRKLSNIRGHRWLALPHGTLDIQIKAREVSRNDDGEVLVRVELYQHRTNRDGTVEPYLTFEAMVTLADGELPPHEPMPFNVKQPKHSHFTPWMIYNDGVCHGYDYPGRFHGPQLRSLQRIRHYSPHTIESELIAPEWNGLFTHIENPTFQLDPMLLDGAILQVGLWFSDLFAMDVNLFPFMIGELTVYGGPPKRGTEVIGRGVMRFTGIGGMDLNEQPRIEFLDRNGEVFLSLDEETVVEDDFPRHHVNSRLVPNMAVHDGSVDLLEASTGRVIYHLEGWQSRHFDIPRRYDHYTACIRYLMLSEPWLAQSGYRVHRMEPFNENMLTEAWGIWGDKLASLILTDRERVDYYALPQEGIRREEFLYGRLAAKEALIRWIQEHTFEERLCPIDIELLPDENGKPAARCVVNEELNLPPISIAHADRWAIAAVSEQGQSIGVDYEWLDRFNHEDVLDGGFNEEDSANIRALPEDQRRDIAAALWCAKESAAKAAGSGMKYEPRHWRVAEFDFDPDASLDNRTGTAIIEHSGTSYPVQFWFRDGQVVAICELEGDDFDPGPMSRKRCYPHVEYKRSPAAPSAGMVVSKTASPTELTPNLPFPDYPEIAWSDSDRDPNELERQLIELWEELLETDEVGLHDDFFDLGGESVLAVRLISRVEKMLGRSIPVANFLKTRTVAQMAEILSDENWKPDWSCLVPMRIEGDRTPLFVTHPVGGNVLHYRDLLARIPESQPVYAFQARGLDGEEEPFDNVSDMAAHYIAGLRAVQEHGPYVLAGFSGGGVIAWEMACQLRDAGEEVAMLALFDTFGPGYYSFEIGGKRMPHQLETFLWRLELHRENLQTLDLKHKWKYVTKKLKHGSWKNAAGSTGVIRKVEDATYEAVLSYEPRELDAPIVLFRASVQPKGSSGDPLLNWEPFATGSITTHEVYGTHGHLVEEPHVEELARVLNEELEATQKRITAQQNRIAS